VVNIPPNITELALDAAIPEAQSSRREPCNRAPISARPAMTAREAVPAVACGRLAFAQIGDGQGDI